MLGKSTQGLAFVPYDREPEEGFTKWIVVGGTDAERQQLLTDHSGSRWERHGLVFVKPKGGKPLVGLIVPERYQSETRPR